ncbi:MAG: CPBP family intramembrane metalloprotease [Actinomycetia bacterium]|nr:CPBP family intramembrane metalloprotease [Actinomycetes bacterium]
MPDVRDSREILDRLAQIDVRQHGGQHGIKTATRRPRLRRSVETPRPWKLADVITIALTLLTAGAISSLVIGNRLTNLLPEVGVVWVRIALLVLFYVIELGVLALLAYRRRLPFAAAYRLRRLTDDERVGLAQNEKRRSGYSLQPFRTARVVVAVIITSIVLRLAALGWTLLATNILSWTAPKSESMPYLFGSTTAGAVAAVLIVAILGPFIEELAFRVIVQEWFATRIPIVLATVITSVIFAASHISLWASPLYLLLGLATSWLAWKSKTIWPAVVLHAIYNATVVIAAFYLLLAR